MGVDDRRSRRNVECGESNTDGLITSVVHQLEIRAVEVNLARIAFFGVVGAVTDVGCDRELAARAAHVDGRLVERFDASVVRTEAEYI